jgi:predicted outer membrane repeat protein
MNINNCLFSNNKAFRGGGAIAIDQTSMTLYNCVFYQNGANEYGLDIAIFDANSSATLINNTFYKSKGIGDGVIYSFGHSLELFNSIIWGNSGGVSFSINAPVIANCIIQGRPEEPGMGNLAGTTDPMLVDDINSYFTLQNNSPCIDKGKNSYYSDYAGNLQTNKGIDGNARLVGDFIDMGATENQPSTGINDINDSDNSIIIFPNPAKETIHISFTNEKLLHTKAMLTDIYGRTVREIMLNSKSQELSMAGLSSGIYILKTLTGNSVKIVKQ